MEGLEAPVGLALTKAQVMDGWVQDLVSAGENRRGSQPWGGPVGDLAAASPPGSLGETKVPGFEEPETAVPVPPLRGSEVGLCRRC